MRDGSILAIGKGNPEWNYSAPHGAGRIMSRTKAVNSLSMDEYRKAMEGIYTTSVNEGTLDKAPMAYKSLGENSSLHFPIVTCIIISVVLSVIANLFFR